MTAEDNVDELLAQWDLALLGFLKGNSGSAVGLYSQRQDVTLANPLGPAVRGWEQVAATVEHATSQVRDGALVDVENVAKYVTPELAYIVRIERARPSLADKTPSPPSVCGSR